MGRGRPFVKGQSGNPSGLPKIGKINKKDLKAFCVAICNNPLYRKAIEERALAGKLSPPMEQLVWYHAAGKPAENVKVNAGETVAEILAAAIRGGRPPEDE
jgi:hypothetical protein